jgi:NTP pyrophosphatase (non-canonical NTP hydrolase)
MIVFKRDKESNNYNKGRTMSLVPDYSLSDAIYNIVLELKKAKAKFPNWPTDPLHALAVLGEEYGELNKAVLQYSHEPHKTSLEEIRSEAIQTAAMAMRFIMNLDQYVYTQSEQHILDVQYED